MMNKKIDFIDSLLEKYNIAIFELSDCYSKNKEFINNAKRIFDCKTEKEINLSLLVTELVCPENSNKLQSQLCKNLHISIDGDNTIEEIKEYTLLLITAMYYNTQFFIFSFNWCYFLENDANSSNLIIFKFPSPIYYELGMTASNEKEAIKIIGEKQVINEFGEFWITGHEENSIMITTFHFKFTNPTDKIKVSISYKQENKEGEVELKSVDLLKGKTINRADIENLNYELGFYIDISISKDE